MRNADLTVFRCQCDVFCLSSTSNQTCRDRLTNADVRYTPRLAQTLRKAGLSRHQRTRYAGPCLRFWSGSVGKPDTSSGVDGVYVSRFSCALLNFDSSPGDRTYTPLASSFPPSQPHFLSALYLSPACSLVSSSYASLPRRHTRNLPCPRPARSGSLASAASSRDRHRPIGRIFATGHGRFTSTRCDGRYTISGYQLLPSRWSAHSLRARSLASLRCFDSFPTGSCPGISFGVVVDLGSTSWRCLSQVIAPQAKGSDHSPTAQIFSRPSRP